MPKRVPTPPPGDDEPRYLTVVHPYAISGTCNMELPKDRQDFARWVACCIDKDAFFAIFHKPSSRGMAIIEVKRGYPHFDRILGEHRWSEFLQKPTEEERERVTQVFYCTYSTGRHVQKYGWKRIDVDEAWFKGWAQKNRHIKSPYPPSHFCNVPVEDLTNYPLCRPLPGAVKTPTVEVIAVPQPVVGSTAWIQTKEGGSSLTPIVTQSKPNALRAWGQGGPKVLATASLKPTANGNARKTYGIPQGTQTGVRMPAVGGGPIVVKTGSVWQNMGKRAPVAANWDDPEPVSRQSTPMSCTVSPMPAHQARTAPPGRLTRKNTAESDAVSYSAYPSGPTIPGKAGQDPAGIRSANGWDSTGASSSPDSDSGPDLITATESDNLYNVHIHFSESMEEEFHGMRIRAEDDEDELRELDAIAPGAWDGLAGVATWEATAGGDWVDTLDAEDLWKQNQETTVEPELCKAHGVICRKGICDEYAKQLRATKRAEEAEQRKAAIANKGKKSSRSKGRDASRKNLRRDEDEDEPTNKKATQNNAFRGPGAPVKTNWKGKPRAIVSADTIEKREMAKAASDDGWGNSDSEVEPNTAGVTSAGAGDAASDASWGVSEDAYHPWATTVQPVTKARHLSGKPPGKKQPGQTKASSNWADQVDAELAIGKSADTSTTISSKRSTSTTSRGARTAKSSTSGWGTVPDMPW